MSRFINADGLHINVDSIRTYWQTQDRALHIELVNDDIRTVPSAKASFVIEQLDGRNHIVQIIPAPADMLVKYKEDDGRISQWKPLCLALMQNGEVRIVDMDADGLEDFADEAANFEGINRKEAAP